MTLRGTLHSAPLLLIIRRVGDRKCLESDCWKSALKQLCYIRNLIGSVALVTAAALTVQAQSLDQSCVVSVLNRTVQVNSNGTWVLPNVPANLGQFCAMIRRPPKSTPSPCPPASA